MEAFRPGSAAMGLMSLPEPGAGATHHNGLGLTVLLQTI